MMVPEHAGLAPGSPDDPSPGPPPAPVPQPDPRARRRKAHARTRRAPRAAAPPAPSRVAHLAVVPDVDGPRVRLGMAWAVVTFTAAAAGPVWIAAWMGLAGGIAAAQTARTWRSRPRRPHPEMAAVIGAALPAACGAGATAGAITLAVLVVAAFAIGPLRAAAGKATRGRISGPLTLLVGGAAGFAAAAPVLARQLGVVEAVVLLAFVGVFDASNYLIGSGATNPWEGPVAGMAFMAAVTLAVAAVFVPPFRGVSPWLLGALAIVLTPAGPVAATALIGTDGAKVPALRRLDSLLLTGPVWVAVAAATVS
jgi:hypothetical protein